MQQHITEYIEINSLITNNQLLTNYYMIPD